MTTKNDVSQQQTKLPGPFHVNRITRFSTWTDFVHLNLCLPFVRMPDGVGPTINQIVLPLKCGIAANYV
jgi:hypothetical protein